MPNFFWLKGLAQRVRVAPHLYSLYCANFTLQMSRLLCEGSVLRCLTLVRNVIILLIILGQSSSPEPSFWE